MERISKYDEAGPGWYWNNFSCGEHTGTHFDAPAHWISGKDHANNTVDLIDSRNFLGRCSAAKASWPSPRRCWNRAWPMCRVTRARRSRT
jgi:kynurenine formamidase